MALVAYNLFSCLKAILGSVHGTHIEGKLSYYYLADELEGTYRGMMIALPPEQWSDFGQMSLTQLSSVLQDARAISQTVSFYFGTEKTEEEKAKIGL